MKAVKKQKYPWLEQLQVGNVYHLVGGWDKQHSIRVTARRKGYKMSLIKGYNESNQEVLICKRIK